MDRDIRVLVVSQYYWPERFGINDVVRRLVESGVEVDVLTGLPNYPEGKIFSGYNGLKNAVESVFGATVFRVPIIPRGQASLTRLALNYFSFLASGLFIAPLLLRKRKYDVVFAYLPSPVLAAIPALWLGMLRRKRVVIWVQDLWPGSTAAVTNSNSSLLQTVLSKLVSWIYRCADSILVSSQAFEESVMTILGRPADRSKIHFLPNSFDPRSTPDDSTITPATPTFDSEFPIVFAGNIGRAQALDTVLTAAELLEPIDQIKFFFVGGGSMVTYAEERIQALNLKNVQLCGQYPTYLMPQVFASASALLVSLSANEVFDRTVPSKVQAYFSSGKPILASVNGETGRIVNAADAGLVTPAEDAQALADSALKLYQMSASDRAAMGDRGRQYFEQHYRPEVISSKLRRLLEAELALERVGGTTD